VVNGSSTENALILWQSVLGVNVPELKRNIRLETGQRSENRNIMVGPYHS